MTERNAKIESITGGHAMAVWELGPGESGEWITLQGMRWVVQCSGEGVCRMQGANIGGVAGGPLLNEHGLELRIGPNRFGTISTPTRYVRPIRDDDGEDPITVSLMMRNA